MLHEDAYAGAPPLYNAHQEWCATAGESPESQTRFGTMLRERGFADGRDSKTRRKLWHGIGLLTTNGPDDGDEPPPETRPPSDPGPNQAKQFETVETLSPRETH